MSGIFHWRLCVWDNLSVKMKEFRPISDFTAYVKGVFSDCSKCLKWLHFIHKYASHTLVNLWIFYTLCLLFPLSPAAFVDSPRVAAHLRTQLPVAPNPKCSKRATAAEFRAKASRVTGWHSDVLPSSLCSEPRRGRSSRDWRRGKGGGLLKRTTTRMTHGTIYSQVYLDYGT